MRPHQRRPGYYESLPPPWRSPREVNLKAGLFALALALALGLSMIAPIILSSGVINHLPPLARLYCPESGRLAPAHYAPRSTDQYEPYACLDLNGKRIEDPQIHQLIRWTVDAAAIAMLFFPAFFAARPVVRDMRVVRKR